MRLSRASAPRFIRLTLRNTRAITAIAVLAACAAGSASAREPSAEEIIQLHAAAADSARAGEAVARARALLGSDVSPAYVLFLRTMLVQSLIRSGASVSAIAGATDTLERHPGLDPHARVSLLGQVAQAMIARGELDRGLTVARRALRSVPAGDDFARDRAYASASLGRAYLAKGQADSAVTALRRALDAPDSAAVLALLGRAQEQRGDANAAIDAYVRAVGVFPAGDTTSAMALRALYAKTHGGVEGLDKRIAEARKASRRHFATSAYEAPAPEWNLPDLYGKAMRRTDYPAKVVVVDFWGSWCGPCRAELPIFQRTYEQYKDRGVAFVGINWERGLSRDMHREAAKEFLEDQGFTFPVLLDLDYAASKAFGVSAFPSLFVIDGTGKIRYRNVGFDPAIDRILAAQIEELLEE